MVLGVNFDPSPLEELIHTASTGNVYNIWMKNNKKITMEKKEILFTSQSFLLLMNGNLQYSAHVLYSMHVFPKTRESLFLSFLKDNDMHAGCLSVASHSLATWFFIQASPSIAFWQLKHLRHEPKNYQNEFVKKSFFRKISIFVMNYIFWISDITCPVIIADIFVQYCKYFWFVLPTRWTFLTLWPHWLVLHISTGKQIQNVI